MQTAGLSTEAPSSWLRRLAAPAILCLIVIGFYWKLVLTDQFTWLAQPDSSAMVLPWMQFQAREWHAGRFPLWDPTAWAGQPLLAQGQPGSAYPLNWLLFLAPLKRGFIRQSAVHWYYVLIRILAALMFYRLCRDLQRTRRASVIAGTVYGIGGYVGNIDWPQMVNGAVWAPLVFMYQFRALRGIQPVRNAIFSGFFLGLMWLCGHHQLPMFISIGYGALWLYQIIRNVRRWKMIAWSGAAAILIAFLVSGLQTVPLAEYGKLAVRWVGGDHPFGWKERVTYALHAPFAFKPLSLLGIVLPGFDTNLNPLIGAVAFLLAIVGLWRSWADERVRWLSALALGSILFALGPASVFHGLLYSIVPGLDKARVEAHALILFHIGIAALVAYGFDAFPWLPKRGAVTACIGLFACGALLAIGGAVLVIDKTVTLGASDGRFMITALACLVAAAVLWGWWKRSLGPRMTPFALTVLILLELGTTTGYSFARVDQKDRMTPLLRMYEDADVRDYLAKQPGPFRIEYQDDVIAHNLGDWWGIETFSTYVASAPERVIRNEPWNPRVQAMLGVRYYFGEKPLRPDMQEEFTGASGRKLFRYPVAFPRAWAVHQTIQVGDGDAVHVLTDPSFDLSTRAILSQPSSALENCSGDQVSVTSHLPNRVALQASMQCRGLIVLSDTYFPGWSATVDGKSTPIYSTNGFVRAVIVDGGTHSIDMKYRPRSVIVGALMTLLGSIVAAFACFSNIFSNKLQTK